MVKAYFLDTSALVKRYIAEIGSKWIITLNDPQSANRIILARVTWVETLSAFSRLQRESRIDHDCMKRTIHIFTLDWKTQYRIAEVDKFIFEAAGNLVQKYPLRAYDSIQLASALRIYSAFIETAPVSFIFVSADERLLNAAQTENLLTENPNNYE